MLRKVALLNPFIPHYREEFFQRLSSFRSTDIYVYEHRQSLGKFNVSDLPVFHIGCKGFLGNRILYYRLSPLLNKRYDTLVLMLHFGHLSTWLLLLTRQIHRKKIILWGQGISVKRYLREERRPNLLLRLMIAMADGMWLYTEKELRIWRRLFPRKPMVALNNTISSVKEIVALKPLDKSILKAKHGIKQSLCFIFCARFDNPFRRIDLLVQVMDRLDPDTYGFIIIGSGEHKPDFSSYKNVYDFGAVYDRPLKDELFALADIYFQPGWIGLSVVEAMAYGKPILTFRRSPGVLQCVEYHYINDGVNGFLLDGINDLLKRLAETSTAKWADMGAASRRIVSENLLMEHMVSRAIQIW